MIHAPSAARPSLHASRIFGIADYGIPFAGVATLQPVHERYDYRTLRIERAAWPRVARAVHGSDHTTFGLWRGEIGWATDEGILMSVGAGSSAIDGVVDHTVERLEATVRPESPEPPTDDGIYAHRWFEIDPSDRTEFVALSQGAWPDFEGAHEGTRVVGLWQSLDDPSRLLLVTRYASLAMWETSRPYNPSPTPGTDDARARFMRRAELTKRTIVRVGRLVPPHPQDRS